MYAVQFHPEYSADFTMDLIDMFGAELMTQEEIEQSRETVRGDVSQDLYGQEVARFFRDNVPVSSDQ